MLKLYSKKASVDVTLGEVRKREKKKEKGGSTPGDKPGIPGVPGGNDDIYMIIYIALNQKLLYSIVYRLQCIWKTIELYTVFLWLAVKKKRPWCHPRR